MCEKGNTEMDIFYTELMRCTKLNTTRTEGEGAERDVKAVHSNLLLNNENETYADATCSRNPGASLCENMQCRVILENSIARVSRKFWFRPRD